MIFNCRLEILDDTKAFYVGPFYHEEGGHYVGDQKVEGKVGGDELTLETVELLKDWVENYEEHCSRAELQILGRYLYNIAFDTPYRDPDSDIQSYPLKKAFENAYDKFEKQLAEERRGGEPESRLRLMLVLHKKAERLSTFPWEFIFKSDSFLAGENTELILARFVPETDPPRAFQPDNESKELRILIALSAPEKMPIVEADDLINELRGLESRHIIVEPFLQPTRRTLSEKIKDFKPHIVHFIGHGREGGLALHKEERELKELKAEEATGEPPLPIEEYADWLDSKSVSDLFSDYRPRLVFLHACKGEASYLLPRSLRSFSSTARDLAYTKIPAVIAMQYAINNDDAQRFARTFYRGIREGKHIDEAVTQARRELGRYSSKGSQAFSDRTFGTPVIYLQSEQPIIQPPPSEIEGPAPVGTSPGTMQKVPCPYPDDCTGMVTPGKRRCLACRRPLMLCPKCGSVMAQAIGLCDNCPYEMEETEKVETSKQPTPPGEPQPNVGDASMAPASRHVTKATPADPAQLTQSAGSYDVVTNGQQTGNE